MFELKELVQALFVNREQEGVYDLKSATRMVEALPENQVLAAMTEIIPALQKLNRNPKIGIKERFRTISYLDERTRPLLLQLIDIHFGRTSDPAAPQRQVLLTIVAFLGEMANAYGQCLKGVAQSIRSIEQDQLQLFTLRGLMYCRELTKWCYTRYIPVKKGIWNSLNQFYQFSEQQNSTAVLRQPYADHAKTSVQSEYLQCLMLAMATPEKLLPQQVDLVSEWLRTWFNHLSLEKQIRPRHQTFAIDISTSAHPRRLQRDMAGENWRYICTENLIRHMQGILEQLETDVAPHNLSLPPESAKSFNIELMRQLAHIWSAETPAPTRKDKRNRVNKQIMIIQGTAAVADYLWQLKITPDAMQRAPNMLYLTVENESASGLGVEFNPKRNEQLGVGEIVAILSESRPNTISIGVIRRLACKPDGEIYAGIEMLTANPAPVEIGASEAKQGSRAIYVPDSAPSQKDRFLILTEACLSRNPEYKLVIQNKPFLIRLAPPKEITPKAVLASFFVLGKIGATQ